MKQSITRLVEAAIERRAASLAENTCVRLFDGGGDGIAGVIIDLFGNVANCQIHAARHLEEMAACCRSLIQYGVAGREVSGATIWIHEQRGSATEGELAEIVGELQSPFQIEERGIRFEIKPDAHKSAGLFIDMRDVRRELSKRGYTGTVINTFCFTGSLGIAASCGGASSVVQIDVSKFALTWARRNAELNSTLLKGEVRYIAEDSATFLAKESRRVARGKPGAQLVIIDPPSFGRSEKGTFQLHRDLSELVLLASDCVASGGELLVTANNRSLPCEAIEEIVCSALKPSGRACNIQRVSPPTIEYPDRSPQCSSFRGCWINLQ